MRRVPRRVRRSLLRDDDEAAAPGDEADAGDANGDDEDAADSAAADTADAGDANGDDEDAADSGAAADTADEEDAADIGWAALALVLAAEGIGPR